jgi:hypothetical protein
MGRSTLNDGGGRVGFDRAQDGGRRGRRCLARPRIIGGFKSKVQTGALAVSSHVGRKGRGEDSFSLFLGALCDTVFSIFNFRENCRP